MSSNDDGDSRPVKIVGGALLVGIVVFAFQNPTTVQWSTLFDVVETASDLLPGGPAVEALVAVIAVLATGTGGKKLLRK